MCVCPAIIGAGTIGIYRVARLIDLYTRGALATVSGADLAEVCALGWDHLCVYWLGNTCIASSTFIDSDCSWYALAILQA